MQLNHDETSLRQYIEKNFKTDSGWIGSDTLDGRDATFLAKCRDCAGPAYFAFRRSKRLVGLLTFTQWHLPLHVVFRDVNSILVDADIKGCFPSPWDQYAGIYANPDGSVLISNANKALDQWLDLDAEDGDWRRPLSSFMIKAACDNTGDVFWLDFPLFTYIDHLHVK